MNEQEYYYNSGYVTIWGEVKDKPDMVIVAETGDGDLSVAKRENLVPKEESYMYKKAQERADELRAITARAEEHFDEVVEKVIDKATSALQMRMKMNAIFSKDIGNNAGFAVAIADELKKLVKEKTPEIVKEK